MVKVCVLMSTYNGEKYIEEQINSILNQKGNFEIDILVRDDGSSDNTIKILNNYQKEGKLLWYKGENLRVAKSFIDLIFTVESRYDYYAFSDQDDWWYENKIQSAIEKMKDSIPCVYYSNPELVDKNLNPIGKKVYKKEPYNNFESIICGVNAIGCSMVFNSKLIKTIKMYEKPNNIDMHDAYISRVCASIKGEIVYDDNSYMKYRLHGKNVVGVQLRTSNKIKSFIKDIIYKRDISISEMARDILRVYSAEIPIENQKWLNKVSNYKKSLLSRIFLALSPKIKYSSLRIKIIIRMSIMLGNR